MQYIIQGKITDIYIYARKREDKPHILVYSSVLYMYAMRVIRMMIVNT